MNELFLDPEDSNESTPLPQPPPQREWPEDTIEKGEDTSSGFLTK
jgi:hypothetical protein